MSTTNRNSLREAILQIAGPGPHDISALAMQLSSRFQQSGLTIEKIEDEIRKVLAARTSGTPAVKSTWWQDSSTRQTEDPQP